MATESHISIYDRSTRIAVISGDPRDAWRTARTTVNALAADAGRGSTEQHHREWFRTPGRASYARGGFRAVNTFRLDVTP